MEYKQAVRPPVQPHYINSKGVTPLTVVIVEDDELVRELGAELLCEAGFRVLEAGDGEAALSPGRWMVLRSLRSRQCDGPISRSSLVPATRCPYQPVYPVALRLFASLVILKAVSG
jgi:hypothetical protein